MRYFSIVPVPNITAAPGVVKIEGSTFDEVECTDKHLKIRFNKEYAESKSYKTEYTIVEFNILPGIHSWIEENTPLELLWAASADFLGLLGKNHNVYIYENKPKGLETLLSIEDTSQVYLPFQVRGSNKILFSNIFTMIQVDQRFLSPLETISEIPEEYIRNALYTYYSNVIPTGDTSRFHELLEVVVPEIEKIEERFRILTRVISPFVHLIVLKKDLAKALKIAKKEDSTYKVEYKTSSSISLQSFCDHFVKKLSDLNP